MQPHFSQRAFTLGAAFVLLSGAFAPAALAAEADAANKAPKAPAANLHYTSGLHFYLKQGQVAEEGNAGAFFIKLISAKANSATVNVFSGCKDGKCAVETDALSPGAQETIAGRLVTFVTNNHSDPVFFVTSLAPAPSPLGVFRVPLDFFGSPVIDLPHPPDMVITGTTSPAGFTALLTAARQTHTQIIIGFGDSNARLSDDTNPDGTFSVAAWESRFKRLCGGVPSPSSCPNLRPYVTNGTLIAFHLLENQGSFYSKSSGHPTSNQVKQMAAFVKSLWPYLPLAIDTGHACNENATFTPDDLDYEIVNISTGNTPSFVKTAKDELRADIKCARSSGLGYFVDVNPLAKTKRDDDHLGVHSVDIFESVMDFAITYPGTNGTLIWRWGDPSDTTIVQGKEKTLQDFWNNAINPGVNAAMKRIFACANNPSPTHCPSAP